jgi:predicted component of type VI protein secretion system
MEENLDTGHSLQGPHHPGVALPPGFVPLRLALHPAGACLEVRRLQAVIGRHSGSDVRVPSPEVSRRHCRLYFHDGFWRVQDLHSLNGVYVNDQKVYEITLYEGDLMRVGDFVFRIAYAPLPAGTTAQEEIIRSIAEVLPRKAS